MSRAITWKTGLAAALLLAGAVVAYALYDAGRLPGIGPGQDTAREVGVGSDDVFWTPETADPAVMAERRQRAQLERERRRHTPWGVKPDDDDPRLTEEQRDEIEKQFKARRQAFRALPDEQRRAIKQQCRKELEANPQFDCTTLWSPPG